MIENSVQQLESSKKERSLLDVVRAASQEVARPILFGISIIIAVYLPIFTLQGLEGRMFRPMAITVCSALLGSLVLALTAVPTLSSYLLKIKANRESFSEKWFGALRRSYSRSLDVASGHRVILLTIALICVAAALVSLKFIG